MAGYFIGATGTGIGKTLITAGLVWQLRCLRRQARAVKPVVSGFDEADWGGSDPSRLLAAMGVPETSGNLDPISPWRFSAPVSPHTAASMEGKEVSKDAICQFCVEALQKEGHTLIEGAGGIMTPLTQGYTQLDLIKDIKIPVILVTGSYVGTFSHTLTALEALERRCVTVGGIVVSESEASAASLADTVASIEDFTQNRYRVFTVPRLSPTNQEIWKSLPTLTELVNDEYATRCS